MLTNFTILTENEMLDFGASLADKLKAPCVVYLKGELGAGKTTLVRGFLRGLGYEGIVKSPTFTLVESYIFANQNVYHFDLYRLFDAEELNYIGLEEYFQAKSICFIEWPERGQGLLPLPDFVYAIEVLPQGRVLSCQTR